LIKNNMTRMQEIDYVPLSPYLRLTDLFGRPEFHQLQPIPNAPRWVPTYSGTTALGLAARSLKRVGRTHLLVPSFNCGHEFEPFLREDFKVDMYRINRSGNIDLDHLAAQLSGRRQVVLVTHFFGFPQPIREITELCQSKNVYVIEDCAHAFLSRMDGRPLGAWGDLSVFSYRKSLPSPDGGALVINNPDIPITRPSIRPNQVAVLKKISQLLLCRLLAQTSRSSRFAFKALCEIKRLLFMTQSLVQKSISKESLHLHSPDDQSLQFSSKILNWRISPLSLKVIGNCDRRQVRDARIDNYRYVAGALKDNEHLRPLFPGLPGGACPLGFPLIAAENIDNLQEVMADFPYLFLWWDHFHPAMSWADFPGGAWLKHNCYFLAIHQDLRKSDLDYLISCAREADTRLRVKPAGWPGAKPGESLARCRGISKSPPRHITVTELTHLKQWEAVAGGWDDLLEKSAEASVFNSFAFLHSYWKRFLLPGKHRLAILVLKDRNGRLVGTAPMMRQRRWVSGFPVRVVSLVHDRDVMDRPQFLLPYHRKEQLRAIFHFFRDRSDEWDIIELKEQVLDPEYEEVFHEVFKNTREFRQEAISIWVDPFLKLDSGPGAWQNYLLTRSKKHRKKWRYLHNRLALEGTLSVTRHDGGEDLLPIMAEYQALEQKSGKKYWPPGKLKKINDLYMELATALRPRGNIHIVFLRLNRAPIAGIIGLSFNERYAALRTVFDGAFSKYSPGFLVGGHDVKWAMEHGFSEYDFMSGFLTDKLHWTDSCRRSCFLRVVRKGAWAGLFYLTKFRIAPVVLSLINQTGRDGRLGNLVRHDRTVVAENKLKKHNLRLQDSNSGSAPLNNRVPLQVDRGDARR
jgi:perosamine synthetase